MVPTDAAPTDPGAPVPAHLEPDHEFSAQDDLTVPLDEPDLHDAPLADDDEDDAPAPED